MPSTPNDVLKDAVTKAYEEHEYLLSSGLLDKPKVRERMFDALRGAKVLKLADRAAGAITRGAMTRRLFPDLVGPEGFADTEDPQLAQDTWDAIDRMIWSEAGTGAGEPLQRMVGYSMGNGYVLCRTRIGDDRTWALYVTDDLR